MKRATISKDNKYFQENPDNIIKYMAICIQCQGIGFIKEDNNYIQCNLCNGNIYINKNIISSILGKG
tara:strand:+ start:4314 stop:4514 length:201 start_codon:yes stop_codon:yes gene_type:complete